MKNLTNLFLYIGIFAVLLRNILVYTVGAMTPGYSALSRFVSELSSDGTPYQTVVNFGSLIFLGLALVGTAFVLRNQLKGPGIYLAMAYMVISGAGFVAIGLFPCPPGCSPEINSTQMTIHTLSGFIATIAINLAAIVYGLGYFKGYKTRSHAISLVIGCFGALAFVLLWTTIVTFEFGTEIGLYPVKGLLQRLNLAAGDLWVVLISAGCLIAGSESSEKNSIEERTRTIA